MPGRARRLVLLTLAEAGRVATAVAVAHRHRELDASATEALAWMYTSVWR